eukprot:350856-Chlamydomonas_euryale.AAC.1
MLEQHGWWQQRARQEWTLLVNRHAACAAGRGSSAAGRRGGRVLHTRPHALAQRTPVRGGMWLPMRHAARSRAHNGVGPSQAAILGAGCAAEGQHAALRQLPAARARAYAPPRVAYARHLPMQVRCSHGPPVGRLHRRWEALMRLLALRGGIWHKVGGCDAARRHKVGGCDAARRHEVGGSDAARRHKVGGCDAARRHKVGGSDAARRHKV